MGFQKVQKVFDLLVKQEIIIQWKPKTSLDYGLGKITGNQKNN